MAINYAEKYSKTIDERFTQASITERAINKDFDFVGVQTVKVYSVPTVAMGDYKRQGAQRYGVPEELQNTVQEMTMGRDRAFTFTVDKGNEDETSGALNAGKALSRQINEVIVPEVDAYRLAKIVHGAGHVEIGDYKGNIKAYERILDAQAALDKLEADRRALRTGMDTAQRKLKQAEQAVAAAEAAVEALTAQQTAAQKELPARSAEELTAQQTALTAARETLRSRERQLSAQLLPNRKTAAQYRAAAEARQTLESRWQWVSALAATAGGTLTSKQKIKLEAYIQMNYLDRILCYANTRLMQMTAGQYELERIGAENQRSQSGLDLGVIDHYNGTRRSVKTLSGGESFKASLALALGLSDEVQSSAGGIRLDTLFLDEGFGSLDEESLELAIRVLSGLTEGDRLVGIISHVGALKDRIDRQVVVHKARTGGSTVELRV